MLKIHALFCVLGVLLFSSGCSPGKSSKDKVIQISQEDPEMSSAIQKARGSLPQFWKIFDNPQNGESGFSLKVKIVDGDHTEHFWTSDLARKDGKILGTINNDPNHVKTVKFGQQITIPEADISDWMYLKDGKIVGNETVRVLMKKLPAAEAEKLKKMLAPP